MLKCKQNFIGILVCLAIFALFGCAGRYEPLSIQIEQKSYEIETKSAKYLLYISGQDKVYYFALYDGLGAPVTNRKFENSSFSNFKFMSRNSSFDELFYEILKTQKREFLYKNFKVKEVF